MLIEQDDRQRAVLVGRLQAQRFVVEGFGDPGAAASYALANVPDAVVADLWMTGVSGVQLCRLLRAEAATEQVPVILRADGDSPKNRFWAEHAGATAYVPKGRIGQLVRALNSAIKAAGQETGFFCQLASHDIAERIAHHLDRALFESVIASEVRALGTCESFERLFDLFSQFACQVMTYQWLAVTCHCPSSPSPRLAERGGRLGIHCHPGRREESEAAARVALGIESDRLLLVEDEDASDQPGSPQPIVRPIQFGEALLGTIAVSVSGEDSDAEALVDLMSRELGGPLKIVGLVEHSQRLALYDPLTGIMNRRAFLTQVVSEMERETADQEPLLLVLLDVDHFKVINDTHGHNAGDMVLRELGGLLTTVLTTKSTVARWGGEEFVLAFRSTHESQGLTVAEQIRTTVEQHAMQDDRGQRMSVTVSLGVAARLRSESLENLVERADRAMYSAKVNGRNRVEWAATPEPRRRDAAVPGAGCVGPRTGGSDPVIPEVVCSA